MSEGVARVAICQAHSLAHSLTHSLAPSRGLRHSQAVAHPLLLVHSRTNPALKERNVVRYLTGSLIHDYEEAPFLEAVD